MELCYKTFVSIGNCKQNFSRLLNAVEENISLLPQPILIQKGHTPFISNYCDTVEFIEMDAFIQHTASAELLILHAGVGSVMNAIRLGKFPIVMPRRASHNEHINDHQVAFSKRLAEVNKIYSIEDKDQLQECILKVRNKPILNSLARTNTHAENVIRILLKQIMNR